MTLEISDAVVAALGLPQEDARRALLQDIAFALYTRGVLSPGKAGGMLGVSRMAFERLLCEHQIVRNYSMEDLEQDLAWAKAELDRSGAAS